MQSLNPKQPLKSIEDLFPKIILNTEAKDKINNKIKTIEQQIIRDNLIYWTGNFGREIYNGIKCNDIFEEQMNLQDNIDKFQDFTRPISQTKRDKKVLTFESINKPLEGRQKVLNGFKSKISPTRKTTQGTGL